MSHSNNMDVHDGGPASWRQRQEFWAAPQTFDVAIIGGGIQGACVYHRLVHEGYRVLLVDRGDFGGGTSQASTMLIWGGLLYLRNGELVQVSRLCAARDRLLKDMPQWVRPHCLRYIFRRPAHRPRWLIQSALWLYWALGGCRRGRPRRERTFGEMDFLQSSDIADSLVFEEAQLQPSDAGFVLNWILSSPRPGSRAVNYCALAGGHFDPAARMWRLNLKNTLGGPEINAAAHWVINAAGVWTDSINTQFGIETPCKHALCKGASFNFPRAAQHTDTLVFDSRRTEEGMSLLPWGPVSLWGSTETMLSSVDDGFAVREEEVTYLLDELNRHLAQPIDFQDIISLRCGIRPLVVPRSYTTGDPLDLSRRTQSHVNPHRPWISLFGGKITGCSQLAGQVGRLVRGLVSPPPLPSNGQAGELSAAPTERFGPLADPVPSALWCRQHTQCWTLEDYLRRRTNIAQWVPRGGLGWHDEYLPDILRIATILADGDASAGAMAVQAYQRCIEKEVDAVLRRPRLPQRHDPLVVRPIEIGGK